MVDHQANMNHKVLKLLFYSDKYNKTDQVLCTGS